MYFLKTANKFSIFVWSHYLHNLIYSVSSALPKSQSILNYKDFYGVDQPENPMSLLKGFDRATVLAEFAALNYRLKPKTTMYYDTSLETQRKELFYFCGNNENLFRKYYPLFARHMVSEREYPLMFTRQTCLYAMEDIIHSDLQEVKEFSMRHAWPKMLEYLLTVNTATTRQTNEISEKPLSLEELSPRMMPLNELSLDINPLYTPFRGYHLLGFFAGHAELGPHFIEYFTSTYGIPFDRFVYEQMSMYYANNRDGINNITNEFTGEKLDTSFHYSVKYEDQTLFNALSHLYPNEKTERLISIRKYPFVKTSDKTYLLTDSILLLDKSYSQFINDFWFDCVKQIMGADGKPAYPVRYYRAQIGKFIEGYCKDSINHSFQNAKYHIVKTFDDLKFKRGNDEMELTDVYIRYDKKVFLAEVKATGLYDEEKYSGDIDKMYKGNRAKFFESFGVDQMVNCIATLQERVHEVDPKFPLKKHCHIYPAIIVNERALQTPLMAYIFDQRFRELLREREIANLHVHALSLLHVSDLEHMEDYLHREPSQFWKILRYHLRDPKFVPPFYNSLNRKDVRPNFQKIKKLFEELVYKYQGKSI